MMMAIAWSKLSHSESLHKNGSAYKVPHFLTSRDASHRSRFQTAFGR